MEQDYQRRGRGTINEEHKTSLVTTMPCPIDTDLAWVRQHCRQLRGSSLQGEGLLTNN
jgi:hypothetical protein